MKRVLACVLLLAAAGCGKPKTVVVERVGPTPAPAAAPAASLPADLFVAAAPAGAVGVAAAKASAKEGDRIVLRGKVGGYLQTFLPTLASFTVADLEGITSCDKMGEDDHCPTPWDYCCEAPEELAARTATIEVTGPDGRPLAGGLEGVHGLKPLKIVVVEGVAGPRPDPKVLVVRATRIHVEP